MVCKVNCAATVRDFTPLSIDSTWHRRACCGPWMAHLAQCLDSWLDTRNRNGVMFLTLRPRRRQRPVHGRHQPPRPKREELRKRGVLHPRPEDVTAELFTSGQFFDPRDAIQVKYEMLRRVHVDNSSVSESARAFGLSRPSFYQAQTAYQLDGVFGLLPHKRGPQGGHKLTGEVIEFLAQQRAEHPARTPEQLADAVQNRFHVQVHPRTIQRRLRPQKKRR